MALIKCPEPECSKLISDKAEFCPHCGHPIRNITVQADAGAVTAANAFDCYTAFPFKMESLLKTPERVFLFF